MTIRQVLEQAEHQRLDPRAAYADSVSYTHLTLPTILRV